MALKTLETSKNFNKALTKELKQNALNSALIEVLFYLLNDKPLPEKYRDHRLTGDLKAFRECHIKPDLLLIYQSDNEKLVLVDLGSHSDLFR